MANFRHSVDHRALDLVLSSFTEQGNKTNPVEVSKKLLESVNVKGEYDDSNKEAFLEMRRKLNTEPGVIIANHPGLVDVALVLQVINRPDLLIMTNPRLTPIFQKYSKDSNFIPATRDAHEMRSAFIRISKHISSGGAFVMFPTGGEERKTGEIEFKRSFSVLLKTLKRTDMVYSFYINELDIQDVEKLSEGRIFGLVSEIAVDEKLNINKLKEEKRVKVYERYSKVTDWDKEKPTQYYKKIFNLERS